MTHPSPAVPALPEPAQPEGRAGMLMGKKAAVRSQDRAAEGTPESQGPAGGQAGGGGSAEGGVRQKGSRFEASITFAGQRASLGSYPSSADAARAYDAAAVRIYGR